MELSAVFFDVDGTIVRQKTFIENHSMNLLKNLI